MKKREYPTPCIRESHTGEILLELPSGFTFPFTTVEDATKDAIARQLHREYGKLYAQEPGTKRFSLIAEDDGLLEDIPKGI